MLHLGGVEVRDSDEQLEEAVDIAKDADAVIAVVGLNNEWELEGFDRKTLSLPGRTNELIERVAAVNPKTVVVTQSVCYLFSLLEKIIFSEVFRITRVLR